MTKKEIRQLFVIFLILAVVFSIGCRISNDKEISFIVAADMRFYSLEKYRGPHHFWGAVESIKKAGPGLFMISPGDVDPPASARKVISQILGDNYPWYPVVGNHEIEDESYMQWLREYNANGTSLPNIVRKGPPGCEETTYAFEWGNCHFVVLNQYYDGKRDDALDGNLVPELLDWLDKDLQAAQGKQIFVFGHEPMVAIPDMDNGRIRHQGDSLDKYAKQMFKFHQLLKKYHVKAYFCGHTHSTSYAKINGVWQIDAGHARGLEEDSEPNSIFSMVRAFLDSQTKKFNDEKAGLAAYFQANKKQVKKTIFYLGYTNAKSYKKIPDDVALEKFFIFYDEFKNNPEKRDSMIENFFEAAQYRKSTFIKVFVKGEKERLQIFRDDGRGGAYSLAEEIVLN